MESDQSDYIYRQELAAAERDLDSIAKRRGAFLDMHELPYDEQEQGQLDEINTLVINAVDRYYQIKFKK